MKLRLPQIAASLTALGMLAGLNASAQEQQQQQQQQRVATAEQAGAQGQTDMQILREKVRADKKALIAANLTLSQEQSAKFWPIYDEYQKDLQANNKRLADTIKSYAEAYNAGNLTDAAAEKLTTEAISVGEEEAAMPKKYWPQLKGAVGAVQAARYLQIENKIRALINYQLAENIPLVE
jgi:hypothetical protein